MSALHFPLLWSADILVCAISRDYWLTIGGA
jgi:hypothetical protein